MTERFSIRFDEGECVVGPLPWERAVRVAERGVGSHGRFTTAELVDGDGFAMYAIAVMADGAASHSSLLGD